MPDAPVMVRHTHLETFIVATLMAMKMPRAPAEITAGLMVRTDLRGVDSHGIGMLPRYVEWWREGIWARRRAPGRAGRRRHGAARRRQVSRPLPGRLLLPLGGSRELGGHQGYGLAVMVDILSGVSWASPRSSADQTRETANPR